MTSRLAMCKCTQNWWLEPRTGSWEFQTFKLNHPSSHAAVWHALFFSQLYIRVSVFSFKFTHSFSVQAYSQCITYIIRHFDSNILIHFQVYLILSVLSISSSKCLCALDKNFLLFVCMRYVFCLLLCKAYCRNVLSHIIVFRKVH